MIRVMMDSSELSEVRDDVPLFATYSDLVPDLARLEAEHPHTTILLIDRGLGDPSGLASIADVETGALKISDYAGWLDRKHAAGVPYLTGYCDRANLAALDQAAGSRQHYRWVATLDGTCHIDGLEPLRSPAAVQILGAAAVGVNCDLSLVYDDTWHPVPEPLWLAQARQDSAKLLGDINVTQHEAQALSALLSAKH